MPCTSVVVCASDNLYSALDMASICKQVYLTEHNLYNVTLHCLRPTGAQHNKGKVSKAGQSKGEKGDKLDDMISSYKAKYFGTQAQAAPAATQQLRKPAAGISRWFE